MIGKTLGNFQITSQIGKGGMGEVYQAKDLKLGRDVAIKVLPEEFAKDADRIVRFQREAKLLASLNHPNIAAIYGLEESNGTHFLVLELIEGDTLADQIKRGPIPVEESLKLALQIAEALEVAHEKGVIHRDLKPANIKVTPEGKLKVLDFGLAKTFAPEETNLNLTNSPTLSLAATHQGIILGTAAYMSPEQAKGKTVDRRTDIWAFGVVLFEMLTGRQLFTGETISETLAAVLKTEPDLNHIPWRARRLIARCLTKDPRLRLQAIGEARIMLDWLEEEPVQAKRNAILFWIVASIVFAGIASWALLRKPPVKPPLVSRWTETLPNAFVDDGGLAISPDGRRLAYVMSDGKSQSIWIRDLDQPEGRLIPGTEGGSRPFFSPDGNWIAYFSSSALKKIPVTGGIAITLCNGAGFYGGCWGKDDIIVVPGSNGLMRVNAADSTSESITTANWQKGEAHRFPWILPGGKHILFTIGMQGEYNRARIAVLDLKSRSHHALENAGSSPHYLTTGHLVYVRSGTMFAVPFDLNRLAVTGPEVVVGEGIYFRASGGFASYTVSDSGLLLYSTGRTGRRLCTLEWRDRSGSAESLPLPPQAYTALRLSPDGRRAAVSVERSDANRDILNIGLERGDLIKLTSSAINYAPAWTPNGQRLVFYSTLNFGVHWTAADGSSKPELLSILPPISETLVPVSFAPNGMTLLLQGGVPSRIWAITLPVAGNKPFPLFDDAVPANRIEAQVSPDGKWIAYTSDESGLNQVYVRAFQGPGGKTAVSINGGQEPRWPRDVPELFYRDQLKNQLMMVKVQIGSTLRIGPPTPLFELSTSNWDVAPDARRFLVAKPQQTTVAAPQLRVVFNWLEELNQLVPVK